jgi:hypothetical protein
VILLAFLSVLRKKADFGFPEGNSQTGGRFAILRDERVRALQKWDHLFDSEHASSASIGIGCPAIEWAFPNLNSVKNNSINHC